MGISTINAVLDRVVRTIYRRSFLKNKYHPYILANDLGKVSLVVAALSFIIRTQETTVLRFLFAFALTLVGYRAFTQLRGHVLGVWSRSYLQDLVVFVVPWVALLSYLFKIPIPTALDLMGFLLPLYLFFIRIGCFLGGCCYGIPSHLGVLYPDELFTPVRGWRNFSPGVNPKERVLPTQLLEAVFNGMVFCLFIGWLSMERPTPKGVLFFTYLGSYGAFRFFIDFYRVSSSRPRVGRFSEGQIAAFALWIVSTGMLVWFKQSN